ncbi:unnamed protein product [Lactuca virosa]|uniref:Uncharacterized protein n=1 Tax=Lactuca virosa TaxID=75947 RepID=A0AAU9MN47_9ASTR|nr:unnamed protein product [Lactuca virosa]
MADGLVISGSGSGISAGKASSSSEDLPVQDYVIVFDDGTVNNRISDIRPEKILIRLDCEAHGESKVVEFVLNKSKKIDLAGKFRCDVTYHIKDVTPATSTRDDLYVQIRIKGKVGVRLRDAECWFIGTVWGTEVRFQIDRNGSWRMAEHAYLDIEPDNYLDLILGRSSPSTSAKKTESGSSFDTEKSHGVKEEAVEAVNTQALSDPETFHYLNNEPVEKHPPTALESSDSDVQSDAVSHPPPIPLAERIPWVSSVKLLLVPL